MYIYTYICECVAWYSTYLCITLPSLTPYRTLPSISSPALLSLSHSLTHPLLPTLLSLSHSLIHPLLPTLLSLSLSLTHPPTPSHPPLTHSLTHSSTPPPLHIISTDLTADTRMVKTKMKELFGKPRAKKDGTEGLVKDLPPIRDIQTDPGTHVTRP